MYNDLLYTIMLCARDPTTIRNLDMINIYTNKILASIRFWDVKYVQLLGTYIELTQFAKQLDEYRKLYFTFDMATKE